jgi:hypothetical protein
MLLRIARVGCGILLGIQGCAALCELMPAKHRRTIDPSERIPEIAPAGGTGSLDAALVVPLSAIRRFLKVLGPGLIITSVQ